jgi:hypothetical protein
MVIEIFGIDFGSWVMIKTNTQAAVNVVFAALLGLIILLLSGCGSDSVLESFVQVRDAPATYVIDDFKAMGLKTSKEYDVEGLPDALAAWKGFWGLDPYKRHDYEIRFYPSHELAVSSGTIHAVNATGAEFEATRKEQVWTEGVKDRWQSRGVTDTSSSLSRQSPGPTYQDWAILGNMVILCDGFDSEQAFVRCASLIDNFLPVDSG